MSLRISTIEEAAELISKLDSGSWAFEEEDFDALELSEELASLTLEIDGPNFHGTVTGGLARGLWLLQKEIYKASAFSIYGVDNYGKIPKSQLREFTLVFAISEGSTDAKAGIWDLAKSVVSRAMDDMTPAEKASLALKIVLAAAGIWAAASVTTTFTTSYFDYKKATATASTTAEKTKSEAEVELARIQAQVARDEQQARLVNGIINSDARSAKFDTATQEGVRQIAKTSPEATRIRVGRAELDAQQIAELNQRAVREVPEVFNVVGSFRVTTTSEPTEAGLIRVSLSWNGEEFSALLNTNDPAHPVTDDELVRLYLAPKTGPIHMNVRIRRDSEGIKEAFIEGFPPKSAGAS